MRAKLISEAFSEHSDPLHDMGIGEVEYEKLQKTYKQLEEYMEFNVEDMEFGEVINTLDYLRRISAYNVAAYFNRKYTFGITINPKNAMGGDFAKGKMGKYEIVFSTSGPGKMVYVSIREPGDNKGIGTGKIKNIGTGWAAWQDEERLEGGSRTLHGLHNKFLYFCKVAKFDLNPYKMIA